MPVMTTSSLQVEEFVAESDAYFERNKDNLPDQSEDRAIGYFRRFGLRRTDAVLDIGCFTGFHLEWLREAFGCACFGIEPSSKAIAYGQSKYPQLNLRVGFAHDLDSFDDASFDVVMIRGTMCLVGREVLLRTVQQIDRVLKEGGRLVIEDFAPMSVVRTQWKHLPGKEVYCYKQPYWEMFTATHIYHMTYAEEGLLVPEEGYSPRNLFKFVVLTKRQFDGYPLA